MNQGCYEMMSIKN